MGKFLGGGRRCFYFPTTASITSWARFSTLTCCSFSSSCRWSSSSLISFCANLAKNVFQILCLCLNIIYIVASNRIPQLLNRFVDFVCLFWFNLILQILLYQFLCCINQIIS